MEELMELLSMSRELGEKTTKIASLEKSLRVANKSTRWWKFIALVEAGVIIFTYAGSIGRGKEEPVEDANDIVIQHDFDKDVEDE